TNQAGSVTDTNLHAGWIGADAFRFGHYGDDVDANVPSAAAAHLVTLRFSTSEGKWIYMDGLYRNAAVDQTKPLRWNSSAHLGYSGNANDYDPFNGSVGEMRVFNYGMTDAMRRVIECQMGPAGGIGVTDCITGRPHPAK